MSQALRQTEGFLSSLFRLLGRPPKERQWRKPHVGVDAATGKVVAAEVTARAAHDSSRVPRLLHQMDRDLVSFRAPHGSLGRDD